MEWQLNRGREAIKKETRERMKEREERKRGKKGQTEADESLLSFVDIAVIADAR